MRIWSLHPKYLDSKGLVALWRETLLLKHVLLGKTKGYTHHPQLDRFKNANSPLECVNFYLSIVFKEAIKRNYNFDQSKIDWDFSPQKLTVTNGQMKYEFSHLLKKLKTRDPEKFKKCSKLKRISPHPLFKVKKGEIEDFEVL